MRNPALSAQLVEGFLEILKDADMNQKVEAQKTFYRTLWGQVMTDDWKHFRRGAQASDFGDRDDRQIFQAAGGDDGDALSGSGRIATDGQGDLRRDDRHAVAPVSMIMGITLMSFGPLK